MKQTYNRIVCGAGSAAFILIAVNSSLAGQGRGEPVLLSLRFKQGEVLKYQTEMQISFALPTKSITPTGVRA